MGTLYNVLGVLIGGALGLLVGDRLSKEVQESLLKVTGVAVFTLGIAGAVQGLLRVTGSSLSSQNSMMMIASLVIGTIIGEFFKIEQRFDHFGLWLKKVTGSDKDARFVDAFVTTSLTICVGAMAVVGSLQDGLTGDSSTLVAKTVLDLMIVLILTASKGKGALFSAVPIFLIQGSITVLARFLAPILTDTALANLSLVGSVLILCVGINLTWGKQIRVANILPAIVIAIFCAFLNI